MKEYRSICSSQLFWQQAELYLGKLKLRLILNEINPLKQFPVTTIRSVHSDSTII
jgi:hypothetical protein